MKPENKIIALDKLQDEMKAIRKSSPKIAFCTGCFDILHSGHAVFFNQCKQFCDLLVVGVGRDLVVKKLKGSNRPINPERNRAFLVASMQDVDFVILNEENIIKNKIDFYNVIKTIKPNFFVLNDDDSAIKCKKEICDELGITLKLVPRVVPEYLKPTSSTEIINKMTDK